MPIKHLVIAGGGPIGLQFLGALEHLNEQRFWNFEEIESIYATSIGTFLGAIICLKYDWSTLNKYIIERPWHDAFKLNGKQILDAFYSKSDLILKRNEIHKVAEANRNLLNNLDKSVQGIIVVALFLWNVIEGAVFENVYPRALVKLYKYPIWRATLLLLIIFSADWSPSIALMLAFTLFFYIMDIEVTRERWSLKELKRAT